MVFVEVFVLVLVFVLVFVFVFVSTCGWLRGGGVWVLFENACVAPSAAGCGVGFEEIFKLVICAPEVPFWSSFSFDSAFAIDSTMFENSVSPSVPSLFES